jgi:molecular chaperone DnaK (HSP70)
MAKKALNKEGEARIECPKLSNGKDLDVKISREKYNELCEDLMKRCVPPIVMAMKDANVSVSSIDEIALVGDFTQTPMVTKMI